MPLAPFKQKAAEVIRKYRRELQTDELIDVLEPAIDELANFYAVSRLAAKIRMIDAGYDEAIGVFTYIDDHYVKPYRFKKNTIRKDQTFSVGVKDAVIESIFSFELAQKVKSGAYLFVDSHFCLNQPKYIQRDNNGEPELTKYARCHMLSRQEYLGHTVNFKTYRKSYKQKKQLKRDPSEWQIFKNTHEAIIDQETFDIVQRIRDGRRRWTPMGEMPILSGMVFCADCGSKLYQVRGRNLPQGEYMVCATYRKKGKHLCTSHQIRNTVIEEQLLDGIRNITAYAREHEAEFVQMVTKKSQEELNRSLRDSKRELEQAMSRIHKLDGIIQRLYEDNIEGKVSNERFSRMSASYEEEQHTLESRVAELKALIASEKERSASVDSFLTLVRKYTDIQELTAEVIREFVEKVYVYQTERVGGYKVQRIRIVWNCIGEFTLPSDEDKGKPA